MGVYLELNVEATAVDLLNNEYATVSHTVGGTHVKCSLVIVNELEGHFVFLSKQAQAITKTLTRLVFKHEEDFKEELFCHLVKKNVFQLFLSLPDDGVGVEGLCSVS